MKNWANTDNEIKQYSVDVVALKLGENWWSKEKGGELLIGPILE